ncbi:MAG TPA: DUF2333 domain-containing protein [Oceanospirillales bacterium]|nr:hypothetical protein [Oceanospirillaceae bacterium]HBS42222.1 DUF2333 domain-containing protein [Oceanospirillales bacterium]|tara:strand:- start:1215 stop:2261 length:1047 start_codon:yes stop_codon:yes gene_type:complete
MSGVQDRAQDMKERIQDWWAVRRAPGGGITRLVIVLLAVYLLVAVVVGMIWSQEPDSFNVNEVADLKAEEMAVSKVRGFTTITTLMEITDTLLHKNGGYLSNDVFPPGLWLDNIPNWEFGALVQVRDFSRALRKDFSRSQSQSKEDPDLQVAEPQFHFDNESWAIPSTEAEYERGLDALNNYLIRLSDPKEQNAQFYARADNLRQWLFDVETRLGSLSLRLSASVGQRRVNQDQGAGSTVMTDHEIVQTPWTEIDDVFYEARGTSWALLHLLKAVEVDFHDILEKKNALVGLRHIIRELEGTQTALWSPVILNGSGFGIFANHSLVMASYISRANAAILDLRELLAQG